MMELLRLDFDQKFGRTKMKIYMKLLLCLPYIPVLLCSPVGLTNLPPECKFQKNEGLLDCKNLDSFPKGPFEDVEIINFSNNNFIELARYSLYNQGFNKLKIATLRYNNISTIQPKAFGMMSSVLQLDLYGNRITNLTSSTFIGLMSLTILNLGNNRILAIQPEVLQPLAFLDKLDLSNNSITQLPEDLLLYGQVTHFDVSENPLTFPQHGPFLASSSLVHLFLGSCSLEELPDKAFGSLPVLQELYLSKNKLREIRASLFQSLPHLKYLDVSQNLITHLNVSRKLTELKCEGNPLQFSQACEHYLTADSTEKPSSTFTLKTYAEEHEDFGEKRTVVSNSNTSNQPSSYQDVVIGPEGYQTEASLVYSILIAVLISAVVLLIIICAICYLLFTRIRAKKFEI